MLPPIIRLGLIVAAFPAFAFAQLENQQIEVAPPLRQVLTPPKDASAEELEKTGDQFRSAKQNLDAIDYFRAALVKNPNSASVYNKIGICELMLQRPKEASKDFEQAIKRNPKFADAYNNLGVSDYIRKKNSGAIKHYKKAIEIEADSASFYNNLGAAYFAKKDFEHAALSYAKAVQLDPTIFEHTSRTGIAAQVTSPEDRAKYDYIVAKIYAKAGDRDHSLEFLRKAMEDGYKELKEAYSDPEFAEVRKDPRFADLMKQKPPALPE